MNNNTASFTGSHIHYIDYDRSMLATFMDDGAPSMAQGMVKGAGNAVTRSYNLKREPVGPRNRAGDGLQATTSNVHETGLLLRNLNEVPISRKSYYSLYTHIMATYFKFITATQESNVDVNGGYIVGNPAKAPTKADWLMQSLCSAHLEVKHQWLDC